MGYDDSRRASEYDKDAGRMREAMAAQDAKTQQVQIDCAQDILAELMKHINDQMGRYGKGSAKYETYSNLREELKNLSVEVLMTKPDAENKDKNISSVIDIMKRTGEASQERRNSIWDSIYQFITGNKVEVQSWTSFKNTINTVKENITNQRDDLKLGPRDIDHTETLSTAAEEATKEIEEDSSSQNRMS